MFHMKYFFIDCLLGTLNKRYKREYTQEKENKQIELLIVLFEPKILWTIFA